MKERDETPMSLACKDATQLLWRRIDEEAMTTREQRVLDGHLDGCSQCRDQFEEFRCDDALIGAVFRDMPFGDNLQDKIFQALRQERASKLARTRPSRSPLMLLAPVAAAAMILFWLFANTPDKTTIPLQPSSMARVENRSLSIKQRGQWQKLVPGTVIRAGSVVRNNSREASAIEFANGTQVTLRADTVLAVEKGADGATEINLAGHSGGEILCSVTPGFGEFRVRAHDVNVTVLGTRFLVRSFPGFTRVVVLEGKVRCQSTKTTTIITRTQEAELLTDQQLVVNRADLKRRTHWLEANKPVTKSKPVVLPKHDPKPSNPAPSTTPPSGPKTKPPQLDLPLNPPPKEDPNKAFDKKG